MSVVLWENLISHRRSRRNPADAGLPPSSLQLVPVTRIEKFVANGGRTGNEELKKKVISMNQRATELSL